MPLRVPLEVLLSRLTTAAKQVKELVVGRYPVATHVYLFYLLLAVLAYLLTQPVSAGDTDLWYHLNGGRLLWEYGQLPDRGFYSYLANDRDWVNYFWGFQALTYAVHTLADYPGLIVLRTLLSGGTVIALLALLLRGDDRLGQRTWSLVLLVLVVEVLLGRTATIRPHLVSYLMITLFLLILVKQRRWLPALPLLTVIWVNLHGVEWPVGAAICGAYFLQALWDWRLQGRALDRRLLAWTAACLPATLLNPFGVEILAAPFNTPGDVYSYIKELMPLSLVQLFSPEFSWGTLTLNGVISVLFIGSLLALGLLLLQRRLQPAPLLLAIVAAVLLNRGLRFVWEWLLLSIPLWRLAIDCLPEPDITRRRLGLSALAMAYILVTPFGYFGQLARDFRNWPVNTQPLPVGIVAFLQQQGVSGHMLSPPNPGGYLEWMLYPKILTSGDMQTPPVLPWDHFRIYSAYRNELSLQRMIDDHAPTLIAVDLERVNFPTLIGKFQQYRPVFFDDHLVLYADKTQLPQLVHDYELHYVNPYNLLDEKQGSGKQRLAELERVLAVYPQADRVQHGIVRILFNDKQYEQALPYALRFDASHPEDTNAPFLVGDILENLDRCAEAQPYYLRAMATADREFRAVLQRHLGSCAYLTRDFSSAYAHFSQGINTYLRHEDPSQLYQYALSAAAVGHQRQAYTLLQQLLYILPPEEERLHKLATGLLKDLPDFSDD